MDENRPRWRPGRRGFYEVWYLKLNDVGRRQALWVRYTLRADGSGPGFAQVWGAWFDADRPARNVALRSSAPIEALRLRPEPFHFALDDALLESGRATGRLAGETDLAWDLMWSPPTDAWRPFPALLYRLPFPSTKWIVPGIDLRVSGTVQVHGRPHELCEAPAEQAHLWGVRHAADWAWAHANAFDDAPGVALEMLSARAAPGSSARSIFHLRTPEARVDARWPRVVVERDEADLQRWLWVGRQGANRFTLEATAPTRAFVGVTYEGPDGSTRTCHNTKVATLRLERATRGATGWRTTGSWTCTQAAAYERVTERPLPGVRIFV